MIKNLISENYNYNELVSDKLEITNKPNPRETILGYSEIISRNRQILSSNSLWNYLDEYKPIHKYSWNHKKEYSADSEYQRQNLPIDETAITSSISNLIIESIEHLLNSKKLQGNFLFFNSIEKSAFYNIKGKPWLCSDTLPIKLIQYLKKKKLKVEEYSILYLVTEKDLVKVKDCLYCESFDQSFLEYCKNFKFTSLVKENSILEIKNWLLKGGKKAKPSFICCNLIRNNTINPQINEDSMQHLFLLSIKKSLTLLEENGDVLFVITDIFLMSSVEIITLLAHSFKTVEFIRSESSGIELPIIAIVCQSYNSQKFKKFSKPLYEVVQKLNLLDINLGIRLNSRDINAKTYYNLADFDYNNDSDNFILSYFDTMSSPVIIKNIREFNIKYSNKLKQSVKLLEQKQKLLLNKDTNKKEFIKKLNKKQIKSCLEWLKSKNINSNSVYLANQNSCKYGYMIKNIYPKITEDKQLLLNLGLASYNNNQISPTLAWFFSNFTTMWFGGITNKINCVIYGDNCGIIALELAKIYKNIILIESSFIQSELLNLNIKQINSKIDIIPTEIESAPPSNMLTIMYEKIKNINLEFLINNYQVIFIICPQKKEKLENKINSIKSINCNWYPVNTLNCLVVY